MIRQFHLSNQAAALPRPGWEGHAVEQAAPRRHREQPILQSVASHRRSQERGSQEDIGGRKV